MQDLSIQKSGKASAKISLKVEVADTDEKRMRGLMFRKSLAAKEGMFFIFPQKVSTPFWMKNTYLPLDILFIGENGHVVDIKEYARPLSEESIYSSLPYQRVLEVNAGFVKTNHLQVGDQILFQFK